MRTIGVVSVARSDYGICLPLLKKIQADSNLQLKLLVGGSHLSPEYGLTANVFEADGFQIDERVEMLLSSDTPEGISKTIGLGVLSFAQIFARTSPDILVVVGDRFEMYSAALAALPFKIPVAHIHGGEITTGAFDEALRHSITKLSHLHFVATEEYGRRVTQLGEEPWRVTVCGAPSLDNLYTTELDGIDKIEAQLNLRLSQPPLLVTFHPVTLEFEQTKQHITELLNALQYFTMPVIFTQPNADTNGYLIASMIEEFVQNHKSAKVIKNLGTRSYFSLLAVSAAMVGNSSSGIIEAPSFGLPVVNVGTRQQGRVKAPSIIDVGYKCDAIVEAIKEALTPEFRHGLQDMINPHGHGDASIKILSVLRSVTLDDHLLIKHFFDWE